MSLLIDSIIENEGFSEKAYPDPKTKGEPYTFGHGLTSITFNESLQIVENRIKSLTVALSIKLPYFKTLPQDAKDVLVEMAYQMGLEGLLEFKKSLYLLKIGDFVGASKEIKNSLWYKQTPSRSEKLSQKLANCQKLK